MGRFDTTDFEYGTRIAPGAHSYAVLSMVKYTQATGSGSAGKFIRLIKSIRQLTGMGLKDAKVAADKIRDGHLTNLGFLHPSNAGHPDVMELSSYVKIELRSFDKRHEHQFIGLKLIVPDDAGEGAKGIMVDA